MIASESIKRYYNTLEEQAKNEYEIARITRSKNYDPEPNVEIAFAEDLAARVESLVGPKGIADFIRESLKKNSREDTALEVIKEILKKGYGGGSEKELVEQSIRTALALITEGVVAAPIEGISEVSIDQNPDGSRYLSVYFAGPIRSAGGTAQALAVLMADYTRKLLGLENYRPTETEIERYVEEMNIYHNVVSRLQYKPGDEELRIILRNCPICITGDPTTVVEVDVYKNIKRLGSNRIRGGMCLVITEGIAQKASKVIKYAKKFGLNWDWIAPLVKVEKQISEEELTKVDTYLIELVAGRPIFAYPSVPGGFRLRYGRARNSGLMAKGIHPASMILLGGFPAIGTQLKIERPGKGMVVVPVDSIEGPVVRLKDGSVIRVENEDTARAIYNDVEEILFNGDMLVSFGDFVHSNHPILPSPYVEEWWIEELEEKGGRCENAYNVSFEQAVEYSEKYAIPLHPRYIFPYHDISLDELKQLLVWLSGDMKNGPEKRILERLLVPHRVVGDQIIIDEDSRKALMLSLNIPKSIDMIENPPVKDTLSFVNLLSPYKIMKKSPVYIGARMGRPEKAKERLMSPAPHILFPVGNYGGATRSILKAYERGIISIELARLKCPSCKEIVVSRLCPRCKRRTELVNVCPRCGRESSSNICSVCKVQTMQFDQRAINIKELLDEAIVRVGKPDPKLKGVKGTTSRTKMFEPLEKGIIRSRHNVHIFKDTTIRIDSTNLPLTHFKPKEIGTSIERLKELGYTNDYKNMPLTNEEQILELFPQDVIPSENCSGYLLNITKFLDELLERFYGIEPYFNCKSKNDLVGHLVIGLAPHTSAGVLGRIIGFTKAFGCYAHPYFYAACRRDCDGDETALIFLMDALVNFSKYYLPVSRGSKMDAPLVLTIALEPLQVDGQVHEMDITKRYPLEFYRTSHKLKKPTDYKIELVEGRLGKEEQYNGFEFTHDTENISEGVLRSSYTQFVSMIEKVEAQLELGKKLRAVDERDEALKLLNSHFLRDIYGNLRAFGEQKFRCVGCNAKFRRVPLIGVCKKCGGNIILTISEGSVRKYLEMSQDLARKYGLSDYIVQRLKLVEDNINSVFISDKSKQYSILDFL